VAVLQRREAAARQLRSLGDIAMSQSQPDIRKELERAAVEPLLPVEKHLIGWSLGVGVALLIVLTIVNHYMPASF